MTNQVDLMTAGSDMELTAARIGFRLETLRIGAGMSADDLAARAGIDPAALQELEDGLRLPTLGTLYSIARALRVQPGDLLTETVAGRRSGVHLPITDDPGSSTAQVVVNGPEDPTRTYLYELRAGEGDHGSGRHPGEELLVVMAGDVVRTTEGGEEEVVHAGESRLIDTSVRHGVRATDEGPARFLVVSTDAPCDLAPLGAEPLDTAPLPVEH